MKPKKFFFLFLNSLACFGLGYILGSGCAAPGPNRSQERGMSSKRREEMTNLILQRTLERLQAEGDVEGGNDQ